MEDVLKKMRNRYDKEENDPIIGYIKNDMFYSLTLEENPTGTKDHYSLNFVKKYDDTCWIVLNKHPSQLYNPMSYLTSCNTFNVDEYDIWTDERSNSLIAVVTALDCD